jgi:carboxypeptidase Q
MLLGPIERPLEMASYGNSVGTPPEGITAEAIVVSCIEELEQRGTEIRDRIVILNPRWTPLLFDESWENYLLLREFRISGHRRAAQLGARAILLRSVYRQYARQAHTGALTYADDAPKIPSAALAPEDAMMLDRLHRRGDKLVLRLKMEARSDGEVKSANVIGELIGRERPEEVVVLGCQFDTWDLGSGALDDGAGAVMVWEPLRLMLAAGLRPRRTVRVMLCTNEENGASGAIAYRDRHADELHNHVAMLESDSGVFPPLQFRVSGVDATIAAVRAIYPLVANLGLGPVATPVKIGTAEDIYPSVEAGDIPALTLQGNNEPYSPFHHAKGDVVDNVPPADLARGTAAIAVMSYVLAEMPERLPRGKGLGARGAMHSQ